MIKELYKLSEEYSKYNIYVWGVNKDSIDTMFLLSVRGIIVNGFLTDNAEYIGGSILNLKINSEEYLFSENDLCIIPKHESRIPENIRMRHIRYSEMQRQMAVDAIKGEVALYGAGNAAYSLIERLKELEINVSKVYVSQIGEKCSICGKSIEVFNLSEGGRDGKIIVSVMRKKFLGEILLKLCKEQSDVYIMCNIEEILLVQGNNFVLALDYAIKENRKIIFVDEENIYSDFFTYVLNNSKAEYEQITPGQLLVLELHTRECCILINIADSAKRCDFIDCLYRKGLKLENFDFASFFYVTGDRLYIEGKSFPVDDALVGISIKHFGEDIIGWKIMNTNSLDKPSLKLVILGNSTSQHALYPFKSWPEMMFEKLRNRYNVTMYNAATSSDDVVNEYLRLVRDFNAIKPDIVISFSGLTNLYNENVERQFNVSTMYNSNINKMCGKGILSTETHYEFWLRIEYMMKNFCEQNGANFLSVLQPINCYMPNMSLNERMQFDLSKKYVGAKNFYESMCDDSIYINLLDLFFHQNNMFIDLSHYSEEGNSIIAKRIYEEIIKITEKN